MTVREDTVQCNGVEWLLIFFLVYLSLETTNCCSNFSNTNSLMYFNPMLTMGQIYFMVLFVSCNINLMITYRLEYVNFARYCYNSFPSYERNPPNSLLASCFSTLYGGCWCHWLTHTHIQFRPIRTAPFLRKPLIGQLTKIQRVAALFESATVDDSQLYKIW